MPFERLGTRFVDKDASGRTVWASDLPPGNLLPSGNTITLTNKLISFPDFTKNNYAYYAYGDKASGGITLYDAACWSWATILPGETALVQELVGTVPAGVNYLDIRATIAQTKAPSTFLYSPVELWVPTGQQSWGAGQGFVVEATQAWRRGFYFVIEAGNVYLRRFQSVMAVSGVGGITSPNGVTIKADPQVWTGGVSSPWFNVWTHGGARDAWLAYRLDFKDLGSQINGQRGAANQPSFADTSDYSSQYTCQIEIRPGHIHV